jgi:hypothetical protein
MLALMERTMCLFSEVEELVNLNEEHYGIPVSSSFAAVDAIIAHPPLLLQMTVSREHREVASVLNSILSVIPDGVCTIFIFFFFGFFWFCVVLAEC